MTTQNKALEQDSEIIELSPKELLPILIDHAINGETVGLEGPPGSGKSELVAQAAKAAGLPLMILNLELSDTTDGKGLPFRDPDNKNQVVWLKDKRWLVDYPFANFMDELPRAVVPVQGAARTLMLENRIDDLYMPKDMWHVWAGNRTADKAGANRVPTIIYQVSFMYATAYSAESQVEWMITQPDLDLLTMRYLRMKGDAALSFDPNKKINATARSWTKVAKKLFAKPDAPFATVAGLLGKGVAIELMAFRALAPSLPSPEEVELNPKGARVPENISAQFLITDMLADRASFNNFDTLVEYAQRLAPEMQAKFIKDSITRVPEVQGTSSFTTWGIKFAEVLR